MSNDKKPTTQMIKLDGTIIKSDGSEYKSDFFKFLDLNPDDYSDISYTPEEAQSIRSHLMHLVTGAAAAIPLFCGGIAKCPFKNSCPFVQMDKERREKDPNAPSPIPVGRRCLIESNLLNEWTRCFIYEYELDEKNFTEFSMVRELAEIELMLYRINNNLAKPEHAELVQETVVGVDKQGNVLTRSEMNAFLEAKERLQNRKSKLIKLMVGDREGKYKREAALRLRGTEDPSTNAAQLRTQLDRLLREAKQLSIKQKEADGNIIDAEVVEEDQPITPEDLIGSEE
jgi:hypothetical protein